MLDMWSLLAVVNGRVELEVTADRTLDASRCGAGRVTPPGGRGHPEGRTGAVRERGPRLDGAAIATTGQGQRIGASPAWMIDHATASTEHAR